MKMIINGELVDAANGDTYDNINPYSGRVIDKVPLATREDYARAQKCAREAQPEWYKTPLRERVNILNNGLSLIRKNYEDIINVMCSECGKLLSEARKELDSFLSVYEACLSSVGRYRDTDRFADDGAATMTVFYEREPLGVFLIFVPFSFPVAMIAYRTIPAIVSGNAVILKPAYSTPGSVLMIAHLLIEAGLPSGVIQCLTGENSDAIKWLRETKKIDAVCYFESHQSSLRFMRENISSYQRVMLTEAGNIPLVVFDSADVEFAVEQAVNDRMYNAGQATFAAKRFIVSKKVKAEFVHLLIERLDKLKTGDPTDPTTTLGPLVSSVRAERVSEQIAHTVMQGAKCLRGGERRGCFITPAVLTGVTESMDVAHDLEIYGPVFSIIDFDDIEEAARIVNASARNGVCHIFSKNIGIAMRFATMVRAQKCIINGSGKLSGVRIPGSSTEFLEMGLEKFKFSFDEYTREKTILINTQMLM